MIKVLFTAKIQNQIPTEFQGKFAEKESGIIFLVLFTKENIP